MRVTLSRICGGPAGASFETDSSTATLRIALWKVVWQSLQDLVSVERLC